MPLTYAPLAPPSPAGAPTHPPSTSAPSLPAASGPPAPPDVADCLDGGYYGDTPQEATSARVWRAGRLQLTEDGFPIPWLWPVARAIKAARRRGSNAAAASLRALAEGGWWTQSRLRAQRLAASALCRCGRAVGTLWHRLGQCDLAAAERTRLCPPELLRSGAALVWDPLYSRGVAARPKHPPPPPVHRRYWARDPEAPCIATGEVYVDGSARGVFWRARRAAWASVGLGADGRVDWTLSGSCNEPFASSFRAEQRALLETLLIAVPPLRVHCDNQMVVDGVAKGRRWCLNPRREGASLWRDIWRAMDEAGDGIEVVKIKAHTSWEDVLNGVVTLRGQKGNAMADATAKAALEVVRRSAPTSSFDNYLARAMAWHKWVLGYAATWGDRVDMESTAAEELKEKEDEKHGAPAAARLRTTLSHELWTDRNNVTCRRCGRSAPRYASHKPLLTEACRGSAAGRAAAMHTGNQNYVWHTFSLTKKMLVEKGGTLTARSTVPAELIDYDRIKELQADLGGFSMDFAPPPSRPPPPSHSPPSTDAPHPTHTPLPAPLDEPRPPHAPPPPTHAHHLPPPPGASRRRPRSTSQTTDATHRPSREARGAVQQPTRRRTDATPPASIHTPTRLRPARDRSPPPSARRRRMEAEAPPTSHNVVITGPITWCTRCARYAHQRAGRGLAADCNPLRGGATPRRLALLAQGRHPITGISLT